MNQDNNRYDSWQDKPQLPQNEPQSDNGANIAAGTELPQGVSDFVQQPQSQPHNNQKQGFRFITNESNDADLRRIAGWLRLFSLFAVLVLVLKTVISYFSIEGLEGLLLFPAVPVLMICLVATLPKWEKRTKDPFRLIISYLWTGLLSVVYLIAQAKLLFDRLFS